VPAIHRAGESSEADVAAAVAAVYMRPTSHGRRSPETAGKRPMYSLLSLISTVIQIYIYILIAAAVLSWLIAFNVVNTRNQVVAMIADTLYRLTEPVLAPIRRILPNLGGIDLSPVVLILLLVFARNLLFELFIGAGGL
jgi:YggT family protein